jgi:hypothetical protein
VLSASNTSLSLTITSLFPLRDKLFKLWSLMNWHHCCFLLKHWSGDRLSCLRFSVVFLSPSSKFRANTSFIPWLYPPKSFLIRYSPLIPRVAGWTARVRFPAVQHFSLLHSDLASSGAQPASYPMGNGGSFPRGKAEGARSWPLPSI